MKFRISWILFGGTCEVFGFEFWKPYKDTCKSWRYNERTHKSNTSKFKCICFQEKHVSAQKFHFLEGIDHITALSAKKETVKQKKVRKRKKSLTLLSFCHFQNHEGVISFGQTHVTNESNQRNINTFLHIYNKMYGHISLINLKVIDVLPWKWWMLTKTFYIAKIRSYYITLIILIQWSNHFNCNSL